MIAVYFKKPVVVWLMIVLAGFWLGVNSAKFNELKLNFFTWKLKNSLPAERYQLIKEISELTTTKEALSIISNADLPVDGELHLLTHVVGETLYRRKGPNSLTECNDDQLYGCTHGLLISTMTNEGFETVKNAIMECQNYSLYQYHMCLHAAGHGFLAYTNYEIDAALQYCDMIGGDVYDINHCYGGVFMENVHGNHDGQPASTHPSLSVQNPESPCDIISQKYKGACYLNQVGWWVQIFEGDYKRVALYCEKIPATYQMECANNYGRVLSTTLQNNIEQIVKYCDYLKSEIVPYCVASVASSMAGMTANEKAIRFCVATRSDEAKKICYEAVLDVWAAQSLITNNDKRACDQFPESDRGICEGKTRND